MLHEAPAVIRVPLRRSFAQRFVSGLDAVIDFVPYLSKELS